MADLHKQVVTATKWSTVTEIAAKLVAPISTMVLARLLTPEAFGVMVTATMVVSFAEIFTDAGFQKYLIQHKFDDRTSLYASTNVAFWSNLIMSVALWVLIIIFCQPIATLVGNPGRGDVIAVSCVCIPLAAFSSIQMALYKRDLDFKTLFLVRIVGVFLPLVVTIPLAFITRSYWSLIIGMIALQLSNAVILTWKSQWKPKLSYSWTLFKGMFSFTAWSMLEALSIWLTGYIDIFIVGTMLDQYYLGLYRTSMATSSQILGLVTAATTPVLFSALSKVQDDDENLKRIFFKFQKMVSLLIMPIGVGLFIFRDIFTELYLGDKWLQAAWFIGIWALTGTITIVLSHYCSEVFRSKGRPKLSTLAQVLHILFLFPLVWWGVHESYGFLCDLRAIARLTLVATNLVILYYFIKITLWDMIKNIWVSMIAAIIMGICGYCMLMISHNIWMQVLYVVICASVYLGVVLIFPSERVIILSLKAQLKR